MESVILVSETAPLNLTPRYSTETAGAVYRTKQGVAYITYCVVLHLSHFHRHPVVEDLLSRSLTNSPSLGYVIRTLVNTNSQPYSCIDTVEGVPLAQKINFEVELLERCSVYGLNHIRTRSTIGFS